MTPTPSAAPAAGRATPESGEAPSRDQAAQGFKGQGEGTDAADCAAAVAARKRLTTLQAHLARRGIELQELASGALQIVAPGLLVRCLDLGAAEAWARVNVRGAVPAPEPSADDGIGTLRARLHAAGWTLAGGAEGFTVSRWGQSRHLADVAAVEDFARQVGVPL